MLSDDRLDVARGEGNLIVGVGEAQQGDPCSLTFPSNLVTSRRRGRLSPLAAAGAVLCERACSRLRAAGTGAMLLFMLLADVVLDDGPKFWWRMCSRNSRMRSSSGRLPSDRPCCPPPLPI